MANLLYLINKKSSLSWSCDITCASKIALCNMAMRSRILFHTFTTIIWSLFYRFHNLFQFDIAAHISRRHHSTPGPCDVH